MTCIPLVDISRVDTFTALTNTELERGTLVSYPTIFVVQHVTDKPWKMKGAETLSSRRNITNDTYRETAFLLWWSQQATS